MSEESNVSHWIEQAKAGHAGGVDRLWRRYFSRLVHAVRGRLQGQNRAISDEEDIALSVFNSFCNAAEKGRFPDLADRDDLWRLLLGMAARKVVDKRRHDRRQRRGGEAIIQSLDQVTADRQIIAAIGDQPSPEMTLMMQESIEQLFSHLGGGDLKDLAVGKLEGYTNAELAERSGCSERTIERRLRLVREKLKQEIIQPDEHPT